MAKLIRSTYSTSPGYTHFEWWTGITWSRDRLDAQALSQEEAERELAEVKRTPSDNRYSHIIVDL